MSADGSPATFPSDIEDIEAYRAAARAWLANNAPRFTDHKGLTEAEDLAFGRAYQMLKSEAGYAAITQPRRFGGGGGTQLQKVVFALEESAYDLPINYFAISLGQPIPIMVEYATEEQNARLAPPAIRGETIWCQLFSEPAAGSDLAALRLSARLDGDTWVLNGQKLWTSYAQHSDWAVVIARHDPNLPKHAGLTYFFLDMRSPGVEVRPVKLLSGGSHVNEVFFDNVRVPDSQRLGAIGDGFKIAIHTLMIERYSVTDLWGSGPNVRQMVEGLKTCQVNGRPALEEPAVREAITEAIVNNRALTEINRRAYLAMAEGKQPGPEGSITKLLTAAGRLRLSRALMNAQGPAALELKPGGEPRTDFTLGWLSAPPSRVAGGTDQILRNTIAEKVLGLPQDHRPDKGVPFNQIPT